MQSKWDFSEAVLLLAEDPAQGSFRKFPEFIITGNCRTASGNGADGASDSKGIKLPSSSQNTAPVFHPDLVIRKGSLILEISNSASDELLSRIGGLLGAE